MFEVHYDKTRQQASLQKFIELQCHCYKLSISCLQKLLQFNFWKTRIHIKNVLAFKQTCLFLKIKIYMHQERPQETNVLKT